MIENFRYENLSCANSMWGDLDLNVESHYIGYDVGSIVKIVDGENKGLFGMIKSFNSNKCNLSSLREKPNDFNTYYYSDLIENLKLISKTPMTKEQYNLFLDDEKFIKPEQIKFKNLVLEDISLFGNPVGKLNIDGCLKYHIDGKGGFVSFVCGSEPKIVPYDNQMDIKNGGVLVDSKYILPYEYKEAKNINQTFHYDNSIDEFIKKSILDYIANALNIRSI